MRGGRRDCDTGGNSEHGLGSTAVLRRLQFLKMLALNPPGPRDQGRGGIQLSSMGWLPPEPFWGGEIRDLRDDPANPGSGKHLPYLCPPPPSCLPPAPSWLALPGTTGKRGHTTDGGTNAEGVPVSCSSPKGRGGGCCTKQVF